MKQITRDLYTSGRVWLSLTHGFTQQSANRDSSVDLVKSNEGYVTLNATAMFVLSLWASGTKEPSKFYCPEYKIQEFKQILSTMYELKSNELYVKDGELTAKGKPSSLYYRLSLANKKYIDVYFLEKDFNGDKSIDIAIEYETKVYPMYANNVLDIIELIPSLPEINQYKQSAAELYYLERVQRNVDKRLQEIEKLIERNAKDVVTPTQSQDTSVDRIETKLTTPKTTKESAKPSKEIKHVDRTELSKTKKNDEVTIAEDQLIVREYTTQPVNSESENKSTSIKSGYDYSALLEDE